MGSALDETGYVSFLFDYNKKKRHKTVRTQDSFYSPESPSAIGSIASPAAADNLARQAVIALLIPQVARGRRVRPREPDNELDVLVSGQVPASRPRLVLLVCALEGAVAELLRLGEGVVAGAGPLGAALEALALLQLGAGSEGVVGVDDGRGGGEAEVADGDEEEGGGLHFFLFLAGEDWFGGGKLRVLITVEKVKGGWWVGRSARGMSVGG